MARVGKKRKTENGDVSTGSEEKKLKPSTENGDGTPAEPIEETLENGEENGAVEESDEGAKGAKEESDVEGDKTNASANGKVSKSQSDKKTKRALARPTAKDNPKSLKKALSVPERKSSRVPPKKPEAPKEEAKKVAKKGKAAQKTKASPKGKAKEEYEVEKVLKFRVNKKGSREFLVRWKGYKSSDDSWEPEKLLSCDQLIADLLEKEGDGEAPPAKKAKTTTKAKSSKTSKKRSLKTK